MFNTYINQLFYLLAASGAGCKIDHLYYGVFAYADDIALLAPSREGLQKMVDICNAFFTTHGINISTSPIVKKTKTKIITFDVDVAAPTAITLGPKTLPYVKEWKHLGHKFSVKISMINNPHIARLHHYQSKDWRSTYERNNMNI